MSSTCFQKTDLALHGINIQELPFARGILLRNRVDSSVEGSVDIVLAHNRKTLLLGGVLVVGLSHQRADSSIAVK
jgi:hypothetical protein